MSDRYRGTIEFPASALADEEIKASVEREGVEFDEGNLTAQWDNEVQINAGIFLLTAPEVAWGQFDELEKLLKAKGIPFDRESEGYFSDINPERVIYRPGKDGAPAQDLRFDLLQDEPAISVAKVRELLTLDDAGEVAASAIRAYLNKTFPTYPPLSDFAEEKAA
jgi:hypothetical protein